MQFNQYKFPADSDKDLVWVLIISNDQELEQFFSTKMARNVEKVEAVMRSWLSMGTLAIFSNAQYLPLDSWVSMNRMQLVQCIDADIFPDWEETKNFFGIMPYLYTVKSK